VHPAHRRVYGKRERRFSFFPHGPRCHAPQPANDGRIDATAERSPQRADPTVDWRALAGFRNVLVHDYLGIDLELVYQSVQEHMPKLKAAAQALLDELNADS
tara:strand:+ start:177 stop:482 length:306 start_codon:yes stop_codon:yes gene_type:complete